MSHHTPLGLLSAFLVIGVFTASYSTAQNPNARINAPGGNPANLPRSPDVHHASEEGRIQFRSQTNLIQVPVVVTEKSGAHVHGLTKDQFQILENGKEQKIATLEEIVATNTPISPAPLPPGEFKNLAISVDQPRSIAVLAIDLVNTPFLDQAYGRQQLIKYLADNVNSGQATALVIFDRNGVTVLQGLTTDTSSMIEILKGLGSQLPVTYGVGGDARAAMITTLLEPTVRNVAASSVRNFIDGGSQYAALAQQDAVLATMRSFLIIAEALSGIPGRKSLIWATASFPFYMNSPDVSPVNFPLQSQSYERAIAALNQAQVSVYPVDVRGLVDYGPNAQTSTNQIMTGPGFNAYLASRGQSLQASIDTMRNFAETTGGRAAYNGNDLAAEFKRAADDASSYYLLGYYLDTENNKAGWRKLKVKVLQKGLEVRAREGFLVTSTTTNPDAAHDADLKFAMDSPFDSTGIPLTVRWKPAPAAAPKDGDQKSPDKKAVSFTLQIPGKELTAMGADNEISVDILAIARQGSQVADNVAQNISGGISPEKFAKLKSQGVDYTGGLHLAAGTYLVRFVVRDNQSGRLGSVTAPLVVN